MEERPVWWGRGGAACLVTCSVIGLGFLWPFYQRAFFRVTLFYRLGDEALLSYGCFLVFFLAGSLLVSSSRRSRWAEGLLRRHRAAPLVFGALSFAATSYLSGLVSVGVSEEWAVGLGLLASAVYAVSLLGVSCCWLEIVMRIVYQSSLFASVIVVVSSGLMGCLLSPTLVASALSTGFVPVAGIAVSSLFAWLATRGMASQDDDAPSSSADSLETAPYVRTWLLPLLAYFVFAAIHALSFAGNAALEVHVADGELATPEGSFESYVVYFLFSALLLIASANALRSDEGAGDKAKFWVALMGVSLGLLLGLLLSDAFQQRLPGDAVGTGAFTRCLTVLLAVTVLFLTYQSRLSPLRTFGLFFLSVYALEKVLTYLVFPAALSFFDLEAGSGEVLVNGVLLVASGATMLLFVVRLCRGNALSLLFSTGDGIPWQSPELSEASAREIACEVIARGYGLTRRELDILRCLAAGHSAKRIGDMLCISERTVQTHSQNIYRKLGVHNRQMVIDLVQESERKASWERLLPGAVPMNRAILGVLCAQNWSDAPGGVRYRSASPLTSPLFRMLLRARCCISARRWYC